MGYLAQPITAENPEVNLKGPFIQTEWTFKNRRKYFFLNYGSEGPQGFLFAYWKVIRNLRRGTPVAELDPCIYNRMGDSWLCPEQRLCAVHVLHKGSLTRLARLCPILDAGVDFE